MDGAVIGEICHQPDDDYSCQQIVIVDGCGESRVVGEYSLEVNEQPSLDFNAQSQVVPTHSGGEKKKHTKKYSCVGMDREEDGCSQVLKRFEMGCECAESCFRGLSPDAVYRHRLNIAELTKEEHDMYLMGVTMACMSDPVNTNKRRERIRVRPTYAYSGRKVCLSAFLYLEHVTLYQLKRIRKHVMQHGVTPRIHGNHGKKPHNVFPLDIYRRATNFLKHFIEQHNHHMSTSGSNKGTVILPPDITRKSVHNTYRDYVYSIYSPNEKILGYSTFRHFMKEQFPNLRFSKTDSGFTNNNKIKQANRAVRNEDQEILINMKQEIPCTSEIQVLLSEDDVIEMPSEGRSDLSIPVLLADGSTNNQTLIVTPLSHYLQATSEDQQTFTFTTIP